jgi:23S rRNA (pseudouridine1915-N3)-methyltransferase
MLNIKIICVGRLRERFFIEAANEYLKRLASYCKAEVVEIPENQPPEKERAAIEAKIMSGGTLVALCVEGREMDSEGLSKLILGCAGSGAPKLTFVIGGSNGLHEDIKNRADIMLSLSRMTFTHSFARIILLEQIYRGCKIIEGGKYHK